MSRNLNFGIFSVRTRDNGTGKEQKITITASSGLPKEEVGRMRREAESHAAEDAKHIKEVEMRNAANTLTYTAEKTIREQKAKITSDLSYEIEGKISVLPSALQGKDINNARRASQELSEAMQKIGAAVYGKTRVGSSGDQASGAEEGMVEGEFRDV